MHFDTFILSCVERHEALQRTLKSLRSSGWRRSPTIVLDDESGQTRIERIHRTWRRMIQTASRSDADFVLLLEDDVVFGNHFSHNIRSWPLLHEARSTGIFYCSLYNPGMNYVVKRPAERYLVAHPQCLWGSQALLLTPGIARFIDAHWDEHEGNPDMRMPRIISQITPIYYHMPSLVDHAEVPTTWGGITHQACDFDAAYRAPEAETCRGQSQRTLASAPSQHGR